MRLERQNMQSPYIGRGLALVLIVGLVGWTAFRALGSRPPESPKNPFPAPAIDAPLAAAKSQQSAVFAGGCFWGVQAVFQHLKGVSSATSGYAGGFVKSPSYESVSMGVTGHAETVSIIYDPSQLTYGQLLMVFFSVAHDAAKVYSRPIVTKVERFKDFYPAEGYHQDYLKNNPDNPYIAYNDLPKLENLKKGFPNLYRP